MLADQTAGVFSMRTGFGAKAGSVCRIASGQIGLIENLVSVNIGNGYFGGRNQPVVPAIELEQVFLELGQLTGSPHASAVNYEWRQDLCIGMTLCMNVEHKGDQSALQRRSGAPIERKSSPGNFCTAFEIQYSQPLADFPVRL